MNHPWPRSRASSSTAQRRACRRGQAPARVDVSGSPRSGMINRCRQPERAILAPWRPPREPALSSVDRALRLLEELARHGPLGATELANRTGCAKATAFRLARTLQARGFVVQNQDSSYRLGPRCLLLATGVHTSFDVRREALPAMEALRDETGETVQLTVLEGSDVVYVEQVPSSKPVRSVGTMGQRAPAHCVSGGLSQLALLPFERVRALLPSPLPRPTSASIPSLERLEAELERVRARGFAINRGGFRHDVGGVGTCRDRRARPRRRVDQHLRAALPARGARRRPARRARRAGGGRGLAGLVARGGRGGSQRVSFADLGFAKVDLERDARQGAPEAVLAEGKTPGEIEAIVRALRDGGASSVLVTRADEAARAAVRRVDAARAGARARPLRLDPGRAPGAGGARRDRLGRHLGCARPRTRRASAPSCAARTSSCTRTAASPGSTASSRSRPALREADCVIVIAGMDAALASVVGGIVPAPVIAVPTSTGYGASFGGVTALLAMLSSCAAGVACVNIDDGFGAGHDRRAHRPAGGGRVVTRVAYVDCVGGAAGDMLLAALIDAGRRRRAHGRARARARGRRARPAGRARRAARHRRRAASRS